MERYIAGQNRDDRTIGLLQQQGTIVINTGHGTGIGSIRTNDSDRLAQARKLPAPFLMGQFALPQGLVAPFDIDQVFLQDR